MVSEKRLRHALLAVGTAVLFVSVVVLEPQTAVDMAIAFVAAVMVVIGLYLSRRAENTNVRMAEREKDYLGVSPDVAPEDSELPRRDPFDGQG